MSQSTKIGAGQPAEMPGEESVVRFQKPEKACTELDQLAQQGAQQMLQAAIEAEVETFLQEHAVKRDEPGRRRVVRNGRLPSREIMTGAGQLEVSQPRGRDKSPATQERVTSPRRSCRPSCAAARASTS